MREAAPSVAVEMSFMLRIGQMYMTQRTRKGKK